jgi:hypothetical protein
MRSSFGPAILFVLALFAAAAGPASAQAPDTVLVNGKIVTVDDRFTIAQALAIKGERILKVGTTAEVEALRGSADTGHRPGRPHRDPRIDRQPRPLGPRS